MVMPIPPERRPEMIFRPREMVVSPGCLNMSEICAHEGDDESKVRVGGGEVANQKPLYRAEVPSSLAIWRMMETIPGRSRAPAAVAESLAFCSSCRRTLAVSMGSVAICARTKEREGGVRGRTLARICT
jgi:hypothetical protein